MKRVSFVLLLSGLALAQEGRRVALVIGNNSYPEAQLQNAINDARAVDKALQSVGFQTILRENTGKSAMELAVATFIDQIGPDDTALFYYAGHAVQIENENMLIPVDFMAGASVTTAKFQSFSTNLLYSNMKRAKRTIVILDACRSNPLTGMRGVSAGLAQPAAGDPNTYIAFSTSPGRVATDNPNGRNSYFTEALADALVQPGWNINDVFDTVRRQVERDTSGRQVPWSQSSLTEKFYFRPPQNLEAETGASAAQKALENAQLQMRRENWTDAQALLTQVTASKPGGTLEAQAQSRLNYVNKRLEGDERFDKAEFSAAAQSYQAAYRMDPFLSGAAEKAVNSYLLADELPNAVKLLGELRARGTSATVTRAERIATELAGVDTSAAELTKAERPKPPNAADIFSEVKFGAPDWDSAAKLRLSSQPDLTRFKRELFEAAAAVTPGPPVTVDIKAQSRDIGFRRLGEDSPEMGSLQLTGGGADAVVKLNGKEVSRALPHKQVLAPGRYTVFTVKQGQIVDTQDIEVHSAEPVTIVLK